MSYSVVVDPDERAVLLVDHRSAQRWLPTGGHVEVDEDPLDSATRELREELGLEAQVDPRLGPGPLMLTRTVTGGLTPGHVDVSLWYVFVAPVGVELTVDEREFADSRWWPFDEVVEPHPDGICFDEHLPRFVAKLVAALG